MIRWYIRIGTRRANGLPGATVWQLAADQPPGRLPVGGLPGGPADDDGDAGASVGVGVAVEVGLESGSDGWGDPSTETGGDAGLDGLLDPMAGAPVGSRATAAV